MSTPAMPHVPSTTGGIDPLLPDLTSLPLSFTPSSDDILSILRARFLEGLPYTSISPRVLVSVNPYQFIQANSDAALVDWGTEYADCGRGGLRGKLGPHVFAMSNQAYYYMRRTGQDQTIMLR